jgi:hypothetical protein
MIGRRKDLSDSQLAAYSFQNLSSKLRSFIGQEGNRRSVHVGSVVAESSGDRQCGNYSQRDRFGNLGAPVADHQQKPVSVFRPRERSQNVHGNGLQRPVRGKELERVRFPSLRYTIPGTKIALSNRLVDV